MWRDSTDGRAVNWSSNLMLKREFQSPPMLLFGVLWKKGDKTILNNYRPVGCLPVASKLLVCEQMSDFLESNIELC